jgi:hypothetical protein
MGCSCSQNSNLCNGKFNELRSLRNQLVTLYNTTKDINKKAEYKELLSQLDEVRKDTKNCPSREFLQGIKDYIENERS